MAYPANSRRMMNTAGLDGAPRNLSKMNYGEEAKTLKSKVKQKQRVEYKIPKTPKDSGFGWGGV